MINEVVFHNKFGEGKITEVNEKHIKVAFGESNGVKIFLYPDSFDRFLSFQNETLQEEVTKAVNEQKAKIQEEEDRKREENRRLDELHRQEGLELLKKKRKAAKAKAERERKMIKLREEMRLIEEA